MPPQSPAAAPDSVPTAIEWLRKHFSPEAAADLQLVFVLDLTGEGGGPVCVRVDRGRLEIDGQAPARPQVRYRLAAEDFFAILRGERNPDLLFMEDRIRIEGDLSLALKFRTLFRSGG